MAAKDYFVHRHFSIDMPKDKLDVWRAIGTDDLPCIQIDQSNGVSASVNYRPEDAVGLARAILEAAEIDTTTMFREG